MALEPHQLGHFHFRRHDAAGIGEDEMASGGAFLGLCQGAVIEPDHSVPIVFAIGRDGDRSAIGIADNERAGGVEAEADDMGRVGAGSGHGLTHRGADGVPDLLAIVLGMIGVGAVHDDGMFGPADQRALRRQDAGPGTPCAHIHSHQEALHKVRAPSSRFGAKVADGRVAG
jgi:hypothetical protein